MTAYGLAALLLFAACSTRVPLGVQDGAADSGTDARKDTGADVEANPPTVLAKNLAAPYDLALDEDNVYFTGTGIVARVPKKGGSVTTIATEDAGVLGVAVDTFVYWTVPGTFPARTDGAIRRSSNGMTETLANSTKLPEWIATDSTAVYWSEIGEGSGFTNGGVLSLPKAAPMGTPPTVVFAAGSSSHVADFAIDATHAYFTAGSAIQRVPLTGGVPEVIGTTANIPTRIAVSGQHLYWSEFSPQYDHGFVWTSALSGNSRRQLWSGEALPGDLVADDGTVFFTTSPNTVGVGDVMMADTTRPSAITLASGQSSAHAIAVDATNVHWSTWGPTSQNKGTISKIAR